MAYVSPQGTIHLCRSVPLNNTYSDSIYFSSSSERNSYFSGRSAVTLTEQSYTRVSDGKMKVQCNMSVLTTCNYLYFINNGGYHESKYYFAFITRTEYISEACSLIEFEIDELMTWLFDGTSVSLNYAIIKRGMTSYDTVTSSTCQPEPITAEKTFTYAGNILDTDMGVLIVSTLTNEGTTAEGNLYGGIYSGAQYWFYDCQTKSDIESIQIALNYYSQHENSIINLVMYPSAFWNNNFNPTQSTLTTGFATGTSVSGYTPKCKKLLTKPFTSFAVIGADGTQKEYDMDLFTDCKPTFGYTVTIAPNPLLFVYPRNYKGITDNYAEGIAIDCFPMCSWDCDTYRAWLAQNSGSNILSYISSFAQIGGGVASVAAGNLAGGMLVANGAMSAAQTYNSTQVAKMKAPSFQGSSGSYPLFSLNQYGGFFGYSQPCYKDAVVIDDYLYKYGYALNTLDSVSSYMHKRNFWSYVQTDDLKPTGTAPTEAMAKIKEVFDRGITFWKDASYVGNYSYDNSP